MEVRILKILAALGIPGVALGILYLLFRQFEFQLSTITSEGSLVIAILFIFVVGGITAYAISHIGSRPGSPQPDAAASIPAAPSVKENPNLTGNEVRVLLALESMGYGWPPTIQKVAVESFGYQYEPPRPEPHIDDRMRRFVSLRLAEPYGGSEFAITDHGRHVLNGLRTKPGHYRDIFGEPSPPPR